MATAREETQPYGGGGGGKILKRHLRRSTHTTPYDRPFIALRNPNAGWLSKLVDPAQRLIASGASRLFSKVFRKRLPPPQPPSRTAMLNFEPESSREERNEQQEAVNADTYVERQGATDQSQGLSNSNNKDGLTELEQILKQKTFTRSEIERLSALLHSKTADISSENQDKEPNTIPSRLMASPNQPERLPKAPAQENGLESHLISTPLVTSSVLNEDIASPAELAKAYMGSRHSKVSPSMLASPSQALWGSSSVLNNASLPSKLPCMSPLPSNSWNSKATENGVITPRSRGRSAIYSMARTPYSRFHLMSTLKGVGSPADAYRGPSSSQSVREQRSLSGSKQRAIKRRSSVLENDIGPFGPIRRIRHKPNVLSSRGLGSRTSGMPLSITETGLNLGTAQSPSFSSWKPVSSGEAQGDFTKASTEDQDNTVPSSSFSSSQSKSSKMASKILQQLDKLVSPKEKSSQTKLLTLIDKSPRKLSSSMLSGQALTSLEDVDSSKFFTNVEDNNKSDVSPDKLVPKAKEDGPLEIIPLSEKSSAKMNGVNSALINKDATTSIRTAAPVASNFVSNPQSKRRFQMIAHEDFLELDDEGCPNGALSDLTAEGREKLDTSFSESKSEVPEPVLLEKPTKNQGTADGSVHYDKGTSFISLSASFPSVMVPSTVVADQSSLPTVVASQSLTSDGATKAKESIVAHPIFKFGDKVASINNSNSASPVLSFGSRIFDKVSQTQLPSASSLTVSTESADIKFSAFSDAKSETMSCTHTVAASAMDLQSKISEPYKAGDKNILDSGGLSIASETKLVPAVPASTSTMYTFSFGQSSDSSASNNGYIASTFKASTLSNNLTPQNSTSSSIFTSSVSKVFASGSTMVTSNGGISTSTPAPSFPAASIFKFGSSTASTAGASISVTSDENKTKQDSSVCNLSITTFSGSSTPDAGTGSSPFGFSATVNSVDNQFLGSTLFSAGSGSMPSAQISPAGTGVAHVQFGSASSSPSFAVAGNTTFSSGSSLSGSISPSKLFSSEAVSGKSYASSSEANGASSSSGMMPSLFGSNWQPAKSPIFGSTFNSTSPSTGFPFGGSSTSCPTAFSFGGSSASSATTNSEPMVFGSSNGASSNPIFSFASSSFSAATQVVFGNSSPSFTFGNNDQMNMEDMAEDNVQASSPAVPIFGQQQPILPSPTNFQTTTPTIPAFGQQQPAAPTPTSFVFGSMGSSAGNPFQFGSQSNFALPQNPSPFQASGSMGFTEGSNFSLGSGGGGVDKSNRKYVKPVRNKHRKK